MKRLGVPVSFVVVLWASMPYLASASVWISEIHYNPEGSDSDYEWIEVHNRGDDSIDLNQYRFREQGVNHLIQAPEDADGELAPDAYAVIADKPEAFLGLYPDYSGLLYDSSFSLKNTGELLALINENDHTVFEVTYDPATGGDGNGASIGLIDDVWYEVYASPGVSNTQVSQESSDDANDSTQEEADQSDATTSQEEEEEDAVPTQAPATYVELDTDYQADQIKVDAGGDRTVMAGVAYHFSGIVYGLEGGIIDDPQARWNWGDGTSSIGADAIHRYRYPGEYTLTFSAHVLKYSDVDRVVVQVIPPSLDLRLHEEKAGVIGVMNNSRYHLEVSHYSLSANSATTSAYQFPNHSYINAGNIMWLDSDTLGFDIHSISELVLGDGEGYVIDSIDLDQARLAKQVAHKQGAQASSTQSSEVSNAEHTKPSVPTTEPVPQSGNTHSVVYLETEEVDNAEKREPGNREGFQVEPQLPKVHENQTARVYQANPQRGFSWMVYALAIIIIALLVRYWMYRDSGGPSKGTYRLHDISNEEHDRK